MKAKVIIENGKTQIHLTPENEFEKTLIENGRVDTENKEVTSRFESDYDHFSANQRKNYRIEIEIIEQKNK